MLQSRFNTFPATDPIFDERIMFEIYFWHLSGGKNFCKIWARKCHHVCDYIKVVDCFRNKLLFFYWIAESIERKFEEHWWLFFECLVNASSFSSEQDEDLCGFDSCVNVDWFFFSFEKAWCKIIDPFYLIFMLIKITRNLFLTIFFLFSTLK